jgi:hypothetical protein
VLGVACRKYPPHVVSQTLAVVHSDQALTPRHVALVLDGEHGKARQVALREFHEGLVGSPLQSVVKVIIGSCGEPGLHAWVRGVSRDVHVDLTTSTLELTVQAAMVRGNPCVVEMVEHVLEQSCKAATVQGCSRTVPCPRDADLKNGSH